MGIYVKYTIKDATSLTIAKTGDAALEPANASATKVTLDCSAI